MLRQEFEKGEKARLDIEYRNSSIVEIISQSKNKLITQVKSGDSKWEVMTYRLSKILNEGKNGEDLICYDCKGKGCLDSEAPFLTMCGTCKGTGKLS